jgi:predicted transcriptional regulator
MTEPPPLFGEVDEKAEARAVAKARAEIAAGKGVSHEDVMNWLRSSGAPDERPTPKPRPR